KITKGKGTMEDLETLERLGEDIRRTALCGLGQTAPNPVLSTLKHFRKEYEDHILHGICEAKVCKDLIYFEIDKEICKKCGLCAKKCPVPCISGEIRKTPYEIDQSACIKCSSCFDVYPFGAISKKTGVKRIKEEKKVEINADEDYYKS
ncbi:MAG TPA: NADH-ubiquinone oxidoreductase-F iron-sulfur binding region domain-containing protein, partial [Exilispira sp.]|nr:NADH-ubiquinone oxidoreductase-F iron-sulfur binding region domain-containing protein [Exilispira sp.]